MNDDSITLALFVYLALFCSNLVDAYNKSGTRFRFTCKNYVAMTLAQSDRSFVLIVIYFLATFTAICIFICIVLHCIIPRLEKLAVADLRKRINELIGLGDLDQLRSPEMTGYDDNCHQQQQLEQTSRLEPTTSITITPNQRLQQHQHQLAGLIQLNQMNQTRSLLCHRCETLLMLTTATNESYISDGSVVETEEQNDENISQQQV